MKKGKKQISFYKVGTGMGARINLSVPALRNMNITSEDKNVSVTYKENEIIIKKENKPMEKKGLDWYKTEIINDDKNYTFSQLYKMIEKEFNIPIIITEWIEKDENLEVYKVYRQLRKLKEEEQEQINFFDLVRRNIPKGEYTEKEKEQHYLGSILGQFTGELKSTLNFNFNFKINELFNMSPTELDKLKAILNTEDEVSKHYVLRILKKEIENYQGQLNEITFTELLHSIGEKQVEILKHIIAKENQNLRLIDYVTRLDREEEEIKRIAVSGEEMSFAVGEGNTKLDIHYNEEYKTLMIFNLDTYIKLQLTDEMLDMKLKKNTHRDIGTKKSNGYTASIPNKITINFFTEYVIE